MGFLQVFAMQTPESLITLLDHCLSFGFVCLSLLHNTFGAEDLYQKL